MSLSIDGSAAPGAFDARSAIASAVSRLCPPATLLALCVLANSRRIAALQERLAAIDAEMEERRVKRNAAARRSRCETRWQNSARLEWSGRVQCSVRTAGGGAGTSTRRRDGAIFDVSMNSAGCISRMAWRNFSLRCFSSRSRLRLRWTSSRN